MAITQTHTSTSQMSGDAAADHILDGSFGFNLNNAVLKLIDSEHNLHADGQTIISDGTFVIGTNASKKLIFSTDDTERIQITTDGALDILSEKLLINGNAGSSGQMLTTDGFGNISWSTPVTQENAFKTLAVSGQSNVVADQAGDTLNIAAGTGISISTNASTDTITITNTNTSAGSEAFRTIVAGGTTIQADNNTDTLTLTPGSNVTFTVDANNDSITINANTDSGMDGINVRHNHQGNCINLWRANGDGSLLNFYRGDSSQGGGVGTISVNSNSTSFNTSSDYRLKENITTLSDAITRLKNLKPSRFNFINNPTTTVDGFLAHEAMAVVPECGTGTKDAVVTQAMVDSGAYTSKKLGTPLYQGLDYGRITPLLTAALQEAIAKIETLETEVAALKAA